MLIRITVSLVRVRVRVNPNRVRVRVRAYQSAAVGQLRVPPDAALHVVVALAVATQVDGVGVDVDVHQVVHDLALDVVLNPVDQEPHAHVHHLDERQVPGLAAEGEEAHEKPVLRPHLVEFVWNCILVVIQITDTICRYNWVTNVPVWFALFRLSLSKLHLSMVS